MNVESDILSKYITPGQLVFFEFMKKKNIDIKKLSFLIDEPYQDLYRIIKRGCKISPKIARSFADLFGMSEEFFLYLNKSVGRGNRTVKEFPKI